MLHPRSLLGWLALLVVSLATACGGQGTAPKVAVSQTSSPAAGAPLRWSDELQNNGRLNVVATVAPISSIVRNIGGTRINLRGIVPDGSDSHTFEPAPGDAKILSQADLVIVNGLALEEPTIQLAEANLQRGAAIKRLGENTITPDQYAFDFSFPKEQGDPNPHLWMSVRLAQKYADLTRQWLGEADPENRAYYDENFRRYNDALTRLDQAIATAVQTIPPQNRRLLTYHDSWPYFARDYGMTVIGAAQPSDFSEPSPQEVADLIEQIRREQVPAVFGSEVFPSKVLEQIAREGGAQYIDQLRDDEPPGAPTDRNHTYLGMMLEDMNIMIPALGGQVDALQGIDPGDTYVP